MIIFRSPAVNLIPLNMRRIFFYSFQIIFLMDSVYAYSESLVNTYQLAEKNSPFLKVSHNQLKSSRAQKREVIAALYPQVSLAAVWSENNYKNNETLFHDNYKGEKYALNIQQSIYDGELLAEKGKNNAVVLQREAEYSDAKGMLLAAVAERYLGVMESRDDLNVNENEILAVQRQLTQVKYLFDRKLAKITDVYALEARLDLLQANRIMAQREVQSWQEQLRELTNKNLNGYPELKSEIIFLPMNESVEFWIEKAKWSSPLLKARTAAVKVADYYLKQQKAKRHPELSLRFNTLQSNIGYEASRSPDVITSSVELVLNVPIYSGGGVSAKIQHGYHQREVYLQELETTKRQIRREVRTLYLDIEASLALVSANKNSIKSASATYDAMKVGFSYQTVTAADMLDALQNKFEAENNYKKSVYKYIKNKLELKRVCGGININDLLEIDSWTNGS